MSGTPESGPIRRMASCKLQVPVVLEGRGDEDNIDLDAIENSVNQQSSINFNISQRSPRINGEWEILLISRGSILGEDTLEDAVEQTRRELINQGVGFQVENWRVEAI